MWNILNSTWQRDETSWCRSLCLLQTFLRVRANRHTRLNGTLTHAEWTKCCVSLLLTQFVVKRNSVQRTLSGLQFWLFFNGFGVRVFVFFSNILVSFVHTDATSYVFRPTPSPLTSGRYHPFSHNISTGLAPTRAEELLTLQLWPLDMLTVDDLCWCRCYVKSATLRPHSAGAHLDCTQAGKTHREALSSSSSWTIMSSCWVLLPVSQLKKAWLSNRGAYKS